MEYGLGHEVDSGLGQQAHGSASSSRAGNTLSVGKVESFLGKPTHQGNHCLKDHHLHILRSQFEAGRVKRGRRDRGDETAEKGGGGFWQRGNTFNSHIPEL